MRNLIDETPSAEPDARTAFSRTYIDLEDIAGRDVLDVGCGFGGFALFMLASGAGSVVGIEPTDRDLLTVRRHFDDGRVSFHVASAHKLPFDEASFDTVVMWEVLEHIPAGTEPQAFREIARVLRPGGRLYLSTPYANIVSRVTDPAWWLVKHRHYSRADVRRLAGAAGLSVEHIEVRGGAWQTAYMLNLYFSKWVLRRPPLFDAALRPLVNREWFGGTGFTNLFIRCQK
jgi:2-polyprenyl-3-methyl-5-hydroxy-6-metoxy-1,4-benzoquinol methylase